MLAHTVAPVLACEDTDQALQPLLQIHGTTDTVHEVFLVRATRALHKYRITSSSAPTDVSLGEHMGQLATEAHSADITGISPAVVRAEVSEQSTSLPGAVPSASDCIAAVTPAPREDCDGGAEDFGLQRDAPMGALDAPMLIP